MIIRPRHKYRCPKSTKSHKSPPGRSNPAKKKVAGIITPTPLHRTLQVNGFTGRAVFR